MNSLPLLDEPVRKHRFDQRLIIACTAMVLLAAAFWSGSRYPALNEKAMSGGDTPLSGLAFDIVLDIFPDSPVWWALVANSVNWIATNVKGMTFGVLFGAALLTALSLLKRRSFKSSFANSALGAAIGAPLGVCVNCAVPIAVGMHMGRMRLETTLSAMMASPTLNVIVVSMTFALLPLHMAVIKLVLALGLVLVAVPLLCKFVLRDETRRTMDDFGSMAHVAEPTGITGWLAKRLTPKDPGPPPDSIFSAIFWYAKAYATNLFTIALITVPMMFVAAVLGSIISSLFNAQELSQALPSGGLVTALVVMALIALVAAFVPAPIALDVVLTIILINIGMRSDYATVALIALGSTSIYAIIVLWRVISPRTALMIFGAVLAMALLGGGLARIAAPWEERLHQQRMQEALASLTLAPMPAAPLPPPGLSASELAERSAELRLSRDPIAADIISSKGSDIAVSRLGQPEIARAAPLADGSTVFTRLPGRALGLVDAGVVTPLYEMDTFMFSGSIAMGDVDGDGWDDVVIRRPTGGQGISLYRNIGGEFLRQAVDLGAYAEREFLTVAFADWTGDGAIDLFASTRSGEVLMLPNDGSGSFAMADGVALPLPRGIRAAALAFADFDNNGQLDMAIGGWASAIGREGLGRERSGRDFVAQDALVFLAWNDGELPSSLTELPVTPGQTLALLVHDFDGNGYPDLLKGDDLAGTDEVLFFGPDRNIARQTSDTRLFPYVTRTSMGYTIGDWNNDLLPDIHAAQTATEQQDRDILQRNGRYLQICMQAGDDLGWSQDEIRTCASQMRAVDGIRGGSSASRFDCDDTMPMQVFAACTNLAFTRDLDRRAARDDRFSPADARQECLSQIGDTPYFTDFCEGLTLPRQIQLTREQAEAFHGPIIPRANLLFTGQADGSFIDEAVNQGVHLPGWSWNSRLADLDQDGWQDLLVMTGIWLMPSRSEPNRFYHNNSGQFSEATDAFGFGDLAPSYSYALSDFDRDGDMDVIRPPDSLSFVVHRNDHPAGRGLWVRLDDQIGNRHGVGATVTICVGGTNQVTAGACRRNWIKASGGYMSFDPITAHFGLGAEERLSLIEIAWPDGEITQVLPNADLHGEITVSRR